MRLWFRELGIEFTTEHKRTLCALTVDESGPGTILRDLEALLAFVRGLDLPVSKTYHLLPRKVLPQINAQLAHPIEISLKQPQIKSYPHIQGLYLLLRATGLAIIGGTPSKPVLVIDDPNLGTPGHRAYRVGEVAAFHRVQPRGSDDVVQRIARPHRVLAGELALAVNRQRVREIELGVG